MINCSKCVSTLLESLVCVLVLAFCPTDRPRETVIMKCSRRRRGCVIMRDKEELCYVYITSAAPFICATQPPPPSIHLSTEEDDQDDYQDDKSSPFWSNRIKTRKSWVGSEGWVEPTTGGGPNDWRSEGWIDGQMDVEEQTDRQTRRVLANMMR